MTGSRRCFECGASYDRTEAGQALPIYCRQDGSLLAPEIVGKRWRLEALLGPRVGGAIFVAYHIVNGQRAALSLVYETPGRDFEERMNREVGAQRVLEPHPNLLPVLELGSDRDGVRFFAARLNTEQPLNLALREWQRPSDVRQAFLSATSLLYPIIKLLHSAHSQGIGHGTLDTTQVYVSLTEDDDGHATTLSGPRLYGLRRMGPGPALTEAVQADLTAIGQILFQLVFGQPALLPIGPEQRQGLLKLLGHAGGTFLLRSLACLPGEHGGSGRFTHAEEMMRELLSVRAGVSSGEHAPVRADEPAPVDTCEERTIPGAMPSKLSLEKRTPKRGDEAMSAISLNGAQPLPALPASVQPRLSSLSNELLRASFVDLLGQERQGSSNEVVARSRIRASLDGVSSATRRTPPARRPSNQSLEVELEIQPAAPQAPSAAPELLPVESSLHSEPTRDLRTRLSAMADVPKPLTNTPSDPEQRMWMRGLLQRSADRIWKR